jgi:hypothetical protein
MDRRGDAESGVLYPHRAAAGLPILVVHERAVPCRRAAETLAQAGFRVEWTTDRTTAIQWARTLRYGLVVSELGPAAHVDAVLAAVAEVDPGLPCLLLDPVATDGAGSPPSRCCRAATACPPSLARGRADAAA